MDDDIKQEIKELKSDVEYLKNALEYTVTLVEILGTSLNEVTDELVKGCDADIRNTVKAQKQKLEFDLEVLLGTIQRNMELS